MGRVLLVIALASCGRLGFDERDSPPIITTDANGDGAFVGPVIEVFVSYGAGTPFPEAGVEGALVLLDDGTILTTDDGGTVRIPAPTARTFHVVFESRLAVDPSPWRVVSYHDVAPETAVKLGPIGVDRAPGGTVMLAAPNDPGADEYFLYSPQRCGSSFESSPDPTIAKAYAVGCEGSTTTMYLMSAAGGVPQNVNSTDIFTYANGAGVGFGAWTPVASATATAENLPAEAPTVAQFRTLHVAGKDVYLISNVAGTQSPTNTFGISSPSPLAANHVAVRLRDATLATTEIYGPLDGGVLDATNALPLMGPPGIDVDNAKVSWSADTPARLMRAFADISNPTERVWWTSYAPAARGFVVFPPLPADLAALIPGASSTWDVGTISAVRLGEDDYRTMLKYVDRDFEDWHDQQRFPETTLFITTSQTP